MVLMIRSAKALRYVHPLFMETGTLTTALFNSRQHFLSYCERDFSCLRSDRNLSYKERLRSGITGINKDDAVHLFQSMLRSHPLPTVIDLNKLFSAVAKTKQHNLVLSFSKKMESNGISFEGYKTAQPRVALVHRMVEMKVRPDLITLTTLVNGLCLKGYVSEAMSLIDRMVEHGFQPDGVTYGTVLNRLCKSGKTSMALDLLRKIIKLDVVHYSIVVDSLCKEGNYDDAANLFNEMETKGIKADVITYNSLIGSFCKSGRWDDGAELLKDMITRKITPDVITFNTLIDCFVKERKPKDGIEPNDC